MKIAPANGGGMSDMLYSTTSNRSDSVRLGQCATLRTQECDGVGLGGGYHAHHRLHELGGGAGRERAALQQVRGEHQACARLQAGASEQGLVHEYVQRIVRARLLERGERGEQVTEGVEELDV